LLDGVVDAAFCSDGLHGGLFRWSTYEEIVRSDWFLRHLLLFF
jgi:hypothetical protein